MPPKRVLRLSDLHAKDIGGGIQNIMELYFHFGRP